MSGGETTMEMVVTGLALQTGLKLCHELPLFIARMIGQNCVKGRATGCGVDGRTQTSEHKKKREENMTCQRHSGRPAPALLSPRFSPCPR
jgi:hypothetical protein